LWLVRLFPLGFLRRLGAVAGTCAYSLASSRRKTALSNLDLAYGDDLTSAEKVRIAKQSFQRLVTTGLEFCYSPKLPSPIGDLVDPIGKEHLFRAYSEGKGVLVLLSHMGNWEVCARWATENFPAVNAVVRKQKQAWVEKVVHDLRQGIGVIEIDKRNALRKVLAALRRGELVFLMLDQHTQNEAVEVQFFGKPAMTSAAGALFAIRLDCAVIVAACFRNPKGGWGSVFSEPIPTLRTGDRDRDYVVNTQRYVNVTEGFIRDHPEDWMWMHRRWRTGKNLRSTGKSENRVSETDCNDGTT
jgi:KDO2-lipid IV(A) lauroyltransferase